MIERMGLIPGLSLDLTTNGPEDNMPWDFNKQDKRDKAEAMVKAKSSLLLVVSPMCSAFSALQRLNFPRMSAAKVKEVVEYGVKHLEFCMRLCRIQHDQGLYFLFEHPATASSWGNGMVRELMMMPKVHRVVGNMCMFDMMQADGQGVARVKKPTGFMTNSQCIADRLSVKCSGMHRHIVLINGRAKAAEVYPDKLCKEIVKGLVEQMEVDERISRGELGSIGAFSSEGSEAKQYWDDLSGKSLNPSLVRKAREEEMAEFRKHGVYVKVPLRKCWDETGKEPIGVRWVDINKGDRDNPEYRSRLVAQEIKTDKREDLFAATPPLEAKKMLLSWAVTEGIGYKRGMEKMGMKLDFIDVRRAYFHARARRRVFVKLPEEDQEEGKCGMLLRAMYGTRDAAQNWEHEYIEFLGKEGFSKSLATPCMFYHRVRDIRLVVHGDDFTVLGNEVELDWFRERISSRFEVKFRARLGPQDKDEKSVRLLNRVIEWTDNGIRYEADQRHAELVLRDMGLSESSNSVVSPGGKRDEESMSQKLDKQRALQYRANVARCNYMCQDRSDVQFQVKELCRAMSDPSEADWLMLKRLARYLVGRSRVVVQFAYQGKHDIVDAWTDTDYAGCGVSRKSTSGGVIMLGKHMIKSWSSTQANIALSSGEAEYYRLVRGASVAIGIKSMHSEMGIKVRVRVSTDASAAKGIASRRGLGKVRHIEVHQLWVQDKVAEGEIEIRKVDGKANLADLLTKHVTAEDIRVHMHLTSQTYVQGRHDIMPRLAANG